MKLLFELARAHPWLSLLMLVCLLVASAAEAIGITTLLPLISLFAGSQAVGTGGAASTPEPETWLVEALAALGLPPTRGTFLVILPVIFALRAVVVLLTRREIGYTIARFVKELRLRLIRALLGTNWSYYVEQRVGTFANAYSTEAMRASKAYLHATWVVSLGLQITVYLMIALAISWQATVASAGAGVIVLIVLGPLVRVGRKAGVKQTKLFTRMLGSMTDIFQGVKPLKAMAREGRVAPMLEGGTRSMEKASRKQIFSREAIAALQEPIVVTILCAGLFVMIRMEFNIASMGVMILLVQRSFDALSRAQRRYQKVATFESAYWSLMERIESAEGAAEALSGGTAPTLDRGIELRSIRFGYPGKPIFEDLSLEIPAGQITALTGPSGGGKTSIVDLVVGLVEPDGGDVLVDGRPLGSLDLGSWRERIGYVPQEMFLLHDTIAMNVALGDPDVSREDIVRALKEANAWDFVSRMPEGVDTLLGERGSAISGGQRQRIAIARAMLHEPWLLVLDEATAALDPESEAAVWAVVKQLRGRTTVLAILHQAALIESADRVFHVEGGVAVEVRAGDAVGKSVATSPGSG